MVKTKIGWAFLPLVAACLAPPGRGMVPTEYASNYFPESAEGTRLKKKHSDLRVVITPPRSAPYEVTTFGPAARSVDIRLVNEGKSPVDIAGFGAVFTAKRNDVEYQCRARDREVVEEHQPSSLSPGESRSFDRDINCLMPMPGRYEIGVYLTFDEGSSIAAADFAESFAFDVLQNLTLLVHIRRAMACTS